MSVPGVLFLVLVVAALVAATVLRRRPAPRRDAPPALPDHPDRELQSLGLSTPRPAGPRTAPVRTDDEDDPLPVAARPASPPSDSSTSWSFDAGATTDQTRQTTQDAPNRELQSLGLSAPRPAAPRPVRAVRDTPLTPSGPAYVDPESPLWGPHEPVRHLLASFAATTGGTVAVLRLDGEAYVVDALAGQAVDGTLAPLRRDPEAGHPLDRAPQDRLLSFLDGDALEALTYLTGADAETALVRALREPPAGRVLVAATVGVPAADIDRVTARLVGDYVDLLAALALDPDAETATGEGDDEAQPDDTAAFDAIMALDDADEPETPSDDDPNDPDAFATTPVDGDAGPTDLPRNVILSGEMAAARARKRPLAFALVTLADAAAILAGDPDGISEAEAALEARLQTAARVRRVEPFGDLLLGVFLDAEADQVSPWAKTLSAGDAPLFVGAVAPAAGQPDAVRAAATEALQRAYEQNVVCVVVD